LILSTNAFLSVFLMYTESFFTEQSFFTEAANKLPQMDVEMLNERELCCVAILANVALKLFGCLWQFYVFHNMFDEQDF